MNSDQWSKINSISRIPVADIEPMQRIEWAIKKFKGKVVEIEDITPESPKFKNRRLK